MAALEPRDPDAPFADQLEWLANRYNPGYFLGGTIRPELRVATLGRHAKRVAGALAFVSGAGMLALLALMVVVLRLPPDPLSTGLGVVYVLAGLRFFRAAAAETPSPWGAAPTEGRQALRAAVVALIGAALVGAVSVVLVVGLGAVLAVARENPGSTAAVAILIVIVVARRSAHGPTTA